MTLKEAVYVLCVPSEVIIHASNPLDLYERFSDSAEAFVWTIKHRNYANWKVSQICFSAEHGTTFVCIKKEK